MNPKKKAQNGVFHIWHLHGEIAIWKLKYIFLQFFLSFTKDIQAEITELESESNIFA